MTSRPMWQIEVTHEELNKYRMIKGSDKYVVEQMAAAQHAAWDEIWEKRKYVESKQEQRQHVLLDREAKKALARQRTEEALAAIEQVRGIIAHTLQINDAVDWETLKDTTGFPAPEPKPPAEEQVPTKPDPKEPKYTVKLSWLDLIISSRAIAKQAAADVQYQLDLHDWKILKSDTEKANRDRTNAHCDALANWERERAEFFRNQTKRNDHIEARKQEYFKGSLDGVLDNCELVLSRSAYPETFPQEFEIDYNPDTKLLVVDYLLPNPEHLPQIKEIKYIQARDEFDEVSLSQAESNKLYDDALYQIALRTMHELFEADLAGASESVVFNGWVKSVDKATGQEIRPCLLTVQANKAEFIQINLERIEPRACFRSLKGIASPKLYSITPVAPLVKIEREDKRFIDAYAVTNTLEEGTNLAAMDWEDFEHLVRELFEKEFAQGGGEVKITRASRDWGVDAIAFDPDPIRGGKIVIQAKRYSNTVDVSSVRDLYGTVINEGAAKGILVTTADFGGESHEFAKGKPLTLLNGSNLLHLLAKHGHKARINLQEARKLLADEKRAQREGGQ